MDQARKNRLEAGGVQVDAALERLMGSEALLERLLIKFAADGNFQKLEQALDSRDQEGAVAASHTLKGMCGNLSMEPLYGLFTRQVEALRQGDWAAAGDLQEEIRPAFQNVLEAIKEG